MDLPLFYCDRSGLASPLVNRQQAVLQVLEAFSDSYDNSDPTPGLAARPVVCFAGHMYGAGKTTFGVRFNEFLVINKEYISQARSEQRLPGCATPEESLDALYNQTLYVYLELGRFPKEGHRFEYVLYQKICETALSSFPNVGRSDAIVRRQKDAMLSRIDLRFLRLDPFSSDIVKDIVQQSRYGKETLREIIFPKTPQGIDWLSEIVWDYTGGVPIYVHYVLSELAKMFVSNPQWQDLSKGTEGDVAVFSSMLLASVLEIPLRPEETYFRGMNLGLYSTYALDIANSFGFYYSYGENPNTFKLVYPKIVLKYLETYYKQIPVFRFISHLFSMITQSDSPVSRGWKFEILFSLVLYLKLCFCSKLGEMGIFQKTFVEDYLLVKVDGVQSRKPVPLPEYVASFSSRVAREVSAAGLTYHPNAWNLFYDKFLSKEDECNGGDNYLESNGRLNPTCNLFFTRGANCISHCISLKCYHLTGPGVGRSFIKDETEKFLIPVAQQLDLKAKNIVVIQLIISTKYSIEVTRQFTDHQNWILNSGTYENDNGHIYHQSLSSPSSSGSANEWLTIPSRCQLVVCSTTSLQSFLGTEAYSQLEQVFKNEDAIQTDSKLIPLSCALTSWLQGMLRDETRQKRGGGFEKKARKKRKIRPRSHANAIQVEDTRRRQSAAALSSMDSSFDWKTFLRERCSLS
eukprot:jgi/Galph1/3280/GphlegSOOS_G1934.1